MEEKLDKIIELLEALVAQGEPVEFTLTQDFSLDPLSEHYAQR